MASPVRNRRYTVEEYFAFERDAEQKHEYDDGYIYPVGDPPLGMAGGSFEHSVVTSNVNRELGNALKGRPCRTLDANMRVRAGAGPRYCYPDASVVCGPAEFDATAKPARSAILNPVLVVEVLSPSTEADDRGRKFDRYREIPSLREYVLVAQDSARVDTYYRQDDETWVFDAAVGIDATLKLKSLGIDLPLAEVYAGVDLPPAVEPGDEVKPS